MTGMETQTINELALAHPESYRVFFRYNIDFCCGGKRQLLTVCEEQDLDVAAVLADLEALTNQPSEETDWTALSQAELVKNIVETHHQYLRDDLPRLHQLAEKVSRVHGGRDPHLHNVLAIFRKMATELLQHLEKEERVLFPLIVAAERDGTISETVLKPIRVMESEHDDAGDALRQLADLTDNYEIKPGMCNSYQALYTGLKTLDRDTKLHIHKENNILFPRATKALR